MLLVYRLWSKIIIYSYLRTRVMTHRTLSFYVLLLNISQPFEYGAMLYFALQHSQISTKCLLCAENTISSRYWVCPQGNYHLREESRNNRCRERWIKSHSSVLIESKELPEFTGLSPRGTRYTKVLRDLDLKERVGYKHVEKSRGILPQDLGAKGKESWEFRLGPFICP